MSAGSRKPRGLARPWTPSAAAMAFACALGLVLIGRIMYAYMHDAYPSSPILALAGRYVESVPLTLVCGSAAFLAVFVRLLRDPSRASPEDRLRELERLPSAAGANLLRTVRWRFMLAFLTSIAIAIVLVVIGHVAAFVLMMRVPLLAPPIRWIIHTIGSLPVMTAAGGALFLALFFLTSRNVIRDMKEITRGVRHIAEGNLDAVIPVRTTDELGQTAYHINEMSRRLRASIEEERHAERTKNELIAGVSHDLRTPLTSVLGFLELIANERYGDADELRSFARIAYEKSLGLKKLTDDLFEYTTVSGGMPLVRSELDLVGFLEQLADEYVPLLAEAGMECRVASELPALTVIADGDKLARAFGNVLANAIRYGRDGRYVDIAVSRDGEEAVVDVANYGEPIPPEHLPRLFDRFYRVEQARSSATGGAGLGLAIARSIVEAHGGRIDAASDERRTVFRTRLPLRQVGAEGLF